MPPRRLLDRIVRDVAIPPVSDAENRRRVLMENEWLVTNGIGGYSSGTIGGDNTRRYHGTLIAALENPLGRVVMLNTVEERPLTGPTANDSLVCFRLEAGLPVWEFAADGVRWERRLLLIHGQNTVHIGYRLLAGNALDLELRPGVHFRGYEAPVDTPAYSPVKTRYVATATDGRLEIRADGDAALPPLLIDVEGDDFRFVEDSRITQDRQFAVEESRGYQAHGALWSPGTFKVHLRTDRAVTVIATTETVDVLASMPPDVAAACERERRRRLINAAMPSVRGDVGAELVFAADQFIITPRGRLRDAVRAKAMGDEIRTIIAGYHWFTDWGRDTMISLEGLTLITGRHREAGFILRAFAEYVRDGLIPNMFPDGSNEGLYHTADATLWFFHAMQRYVDMTDDRELLLHVLDTMRGIVDRHIAGTRFGIAMDPADGLLRQGSEGYQLTWMDAKVDGWVVTPRRGKAVEINALWYNALMLVAEWIAHFRGDDEARPYAELARRVFTSFNRRFWSEELGYLYDVVDGPGPDASALAAESRECRPNQLLAISLQHPVLARARWERVVAVVQERLLTPVGLRSLAPGEPDYKNKYFGDLRTRDAAYHQGTVWAWLIGPWVDAWLKLHPDDQAGARDFLDGLVARLGEFGVGSVAEIFDATEPYAARGCIAQAWSVAELLRCWVKTEPGDVPPRVRRKREPRARDARRPVSA